MDSHALALKCVAERKAVLKQLCRHFQLCDDISTYLISKCMYSNHLKCEGCNKCVLQKVFFCGPLLSRPVSDRNMEQYIFNMKDTYHMVKKSMHFSDETKFEYDQNAEVEKCKYDIICGTCYSPTLDVLKKRLNHNNYIYK